MASRSASLVLATLFVSAGFVACGGATSSELFGGAGASNADGSAPGAEAASTADGAAPDDASSSPDAPARDGGNSDARARDAGTVTCQEVLGHIETLRPQIIQCFPSVGLQCDQQIDDVCCPLTLNNSSTGSKDVQNFMAAVAQFKKMNCHATCPAIPCTDSPTEQCVVNGVSNFTCAQ